MCAHRGTSEGCLGDSGMSTQLWIDTYRPMIAKHVCGNGSKVKELRTWIKERIERDAPPPPQKGKRKGRRASDSSDGKLFPGKCD
jgi:hypothetical protein